MKKLEIGMFDTHCLALDFHQYRLVLYPKWKFIEFPKGYKYYKYPTLHVL